MLSNATVDEVLHSVAPDVCVDRDCLARLMLERPHPDTLIPMLPTAQLETVRAAVLYVGVYGSMRDCPLLAMCLQHQDEGVARIAEYGLWSVWMQAGSDTGNRQLAAAIRCIRDSSFSAALQLLSGLIAAEPTFAEAHFQQGIALSLLERTAEAEQAFRRALRLNPYHFGAFAALGHACVEQANLVGALHYYRKALRVHPRLDDLPGAVRQLETRLRRFRRPRLDDAEG